MAWMVRGINSPKIGLESSNTLLTGIIANRISLIESMMNVMEK